MTTGTGNDNDPSGLIVIRCFQNSFLKIKVMLYKRTIYILTAILCWTAFLLPCIGQSGARELVILHTNDTHSHVDPVKAGPEAGLGGVIERAAYIDSVRSAVGKRNLLLVDAGDFSQGTSYFTVLKGDIEIELLNGMGYDAVCLGNHEFDNGPEELARRLRNAKFDVVCANYDFSGSVLDRYVEPYTVIRKGGRKIGIIGLLVDVTKVVDRSVAETMKYLDPVETVNRYAALLRDKGCDMVIVLSHFGIEKSEFTDIRLAEASRNVDIIIGGHSHTFLEEPVYVRNADGKEVTIVTDGCWGLYVGRLDIE